MHKKTFFSVGSVVLALLASQHHTLHMLLLMFGIGGASMSFMAMYPILRRTMLLMALLMVIATAYQLRQRQQRRIMHVFSIISIVVTLGLLAWSTLQFGL